LPNERSGIDQNMRKLEDMRPENIDEFYRVAVCSVTVYNVYKI